MTRSESAAAELRKAGAINAPDARALQGATAPKEWKGKTKDGEWKVKKNGSDSYTVEC